jgi:hypothetical protein
MARLRRRSCSTRTDRQRISDGGLFSPVPSVRKRQWRVGIEYGETAPCASFQYQAIARVTLLQIGRTRFSSPFLNPCGQVGHFGVQGSNDLALRLDAPRSFVITATPYSPTANRASHFRARLGALAPPKRGSSLRGDFWTGIASEWSVTRAQSPTSRGETFRLARNKTSSRYSSGAPRQ